jgi:hypothetical protein
MEIIADNIKLAQNNPKHHKKDKQFKKNQNTIHACLEAFTPF